MVETMNNIRSTSFAFSALLLLGCSSGGVGVDVRAVTSSNAPAGTADQMEISDSGGSAFAIRTAGLHLRDIELDLPDGQRCSDIADSLVGAECDDSLDSDDTIRIVGPFDIDLVTGIATPDLSGVVIPEGTYRRVDFRVENAEGTPSFAFTANFDHGGEAMVLDLSLDFNEDVRLESLEGIAVSADTDLVAALVADTWLSGVDIGSCIDDGDVLVEGATVILDESSSSGSCSDVENTIKTNMKQSGQLDRR